MTAEVESMFEPRTFISVFVQTHRITFGRVQIFVGLASPPTTQRNSGKADTDRPTGIVETLPKQTHCWVLPLRS